jgi:hypothetical protein
LVIVVYFPISERSPPSASNPPHFGSPIPRAGLVHPCLPRDGAVDAPTAPAPRAPTSLATTPWTPRRRLPDASPSMAPRLPASPTTAPAPRIPVSAGALPGRHLRPPPFVGAASSSIPWPPPAFPLFPTGAAPNSWAGPSIGRRRHHSPGLQVASSSFTV